MSRKSVRPVLLVGLSLLGCSGGGGVGPDSTGTISGIVRNASTSEALPGALVSVGSIQATTDDQGGFVLTGAPTGPSVTIRSERAGYDTYSASIAVAEGTTTHDIAMTRRSVYVVPDFAVYVPPGLETVRGVILGMGGYDTRGYATEEYVGPDLEIRESQRLNRQGFLALAATHGLAVMGSQPLRDGPSSDDRLLAALDAIATMSDHPELALAPILIWGISGSVPLTYGLALRHPGRVIGFTAIIGVTPSTARSQATQRVPGYVMLAERDNVVDNGELTAFFQANRSEGAIWSFAVEPGATHAATSPRARALLLSWMNTILELRLPATVTPRTPIRLRDIEQASGWLGHRTTFAIADYAGYPENKLEASWSPTEESALAWQQFVRPVATD